MSKKHVKIMVRHPIDSRKGPDEWDGKVHECDVDLRDVHALGVWLSKKMGIKFSYRVGESRMIDGRAVFFPRRYTTGVHCAWVEPA